jgi:hypothetical protein
MARGILGDDGPTLWTFIAVILMWGAFKTWFSETKENVKDTLGIGQNTAGPLQAETSADIKTMEGQVKSWHCDYSKLPNGPTYYSNIANKLWSEIDVPKLINVDEAAAIALLKPLSKNELMAVAKAFGVREDTSLGLTTWSGHIFRALDRAFTGMFKAGDMAQMKKIWAPTKLW